MRFDIYTNLSRSSIECLLLIDLIYIDNTFMSIPDLTSWIPALKIVTFKYSWYWGSKVHCSSWQIPYPSSRNINWFKARFMVSKHLPNIFIFIMCRHSDMQENMNYQSISVAVYLVNLKVRAIERKASSISCSTWYLHMTIYTRHT